VAPGPFVVGLLAGDTGRRGLKWAVAIVFWLVVVQLGVVTTLVVLAVSSAAPAAACPVAATDSVSLLGPPLTTADRIVAWWGRRGEPARLGVSVPRLVDLYYAEGTAEGVRPELALAQAVHETGHFTSSDTAINNFAGIGHPDGAGSGRRFGSPELGVRAHVQLLRAYAEGNEVEFATERVAPQAGARAATLLELTGTWATDPNYATKVATVLATMVGGAATPTAEPAEPAEPLTADTVASCGGLTGAPISADGYALPVDRTWFDRYPRWFSKPHHDYPASDIPVPEGAPIYAMVSGVVTAAPVGGNCGLGVAYRGDDGLAYIACHGSDGGLIVGPGDRVTAGQLIMHASWTGRVVPAGPGGTHLHQGVRRNGVDVCPQPMFSAIAEGRPVDLGVLPTSGCSY
jgi:murein DD-endopeptidase MepM/ murein hydrolase activator NlpD